MTINLVNSFPEVWECPSLMVIYQSFKSKWFTSHLNFSVHLIFIYAYTYNISIYSFNCNTIHCQFKSLALLRKDRQKGERRQHLKMLANHKYPLQSAEISQEGSEVHEKFMFRCCVHTDINIIWITLQTICLDGQWKWEFHGQVSITTHMINTKLYVS